jgi:hypothetical protein
MLYPMVYPLEVVLVENIENLLLAVVVFDLLLALRLFRQIFSYFLLESLDCFLDPYIVELFFLRLRFV